VEIIEVEDDVAKPAGLRSHEDQPAATEITGMPQEQPAVEVSESEITSSCI